MFLRRSLAHISYNFFSRYIFLLACQLVPPENEDPFQVRIFFLAGGGGGGG